MPMVEYQTHPYYYFVVAAAALFFWHSIILTTSLVLGAIFVVVVILFTSRLFDSSSPVTMNVPMLPVEVDHAHGE